MSEEKQDESAPNSSSPGAVTDKKTLQQQQRKHKFAHYALRYKAHQESWQLEAQVRHVTIERVHEALKLSHEGELKWIQGGSVANPYAEKELEMGTENMLKKFEEKEVSVENFYFQTYAAVDFIVAAYDELERDRLFLKWTYPFYYLEFDNENANNQSNSKTANSPQENSKGPNGRGSFVQVDTRGEYLALQAAMEFYTETLSSLISRNRLRATKQEIETATRHVRAKRIEMEEWIIHYYFTRKPEVQPEMLPSATSSLTSHSSLKDEGAEEEEEEDLEPVQLVPSQGTWYCIPYLMRLVPNFTYVAYDTIAIWFCVGCS